MNNELEEEEQKKKKAIVKSLYAVYRNQTQKHGIDRFWYNFQSKIRPGD